MAIGEVNRFSLPFAAILKENRWLKRMAVYKTGFVWALFGLCLGVARHGPTSGGRMYILLPFYSLPVSLRALPFSSQ